MSPPHSIELLPKTLNQTYTIGIQNNDKEDNDKQDNKKLDNNKQNNEE